MGQHKITLHQVLLLSLKPNTCLIEKNQNHLDKITHKLIKSGVAAWAPDVISGRDRLIIRGRSNLIGDLENQEEIEKIRILFDDLEKKKDLEHLLDLTEEGEGVRVFIGSENKLFSLSESSLVLEPVWCGMFDCKDILIDIFEFKQYKNDKN